MRPFEKIILGLILAGMAFATSIVLLIMTVSYLQSSHVKNTARGAGVVWDRLIGK